jgi:hypothetical protein
VAYYQGDYYQGDYYSGDPFWGGIWSAVKGVGKLALGLGASFGKGKSKGPQALQVGSNRAMVRAMPGIAGGLLGGAAAKWWFGMTEAQVRAKDPYGRLNQEWQIFQNQQNLLQKSPGFKGRMQRLLPGGETGYYMRRRARMNVANPRALRRSLRRVAGFGKLCARARRDIGRAATSVGANRSRGGPVARHHARIRRAA